MTLLCVKLPIFVILTVREGTGYQKPKMNHSTFGWVLSPAENRTRASGSVTILKVKNIDLILVNILFNLKTLVFLLQQSNT